MDNDGYERVKALGKGAYGTAYLCEKRLPDGGKQKCVVKEIDTSKMRESEILQAIGEARNLSSMNHPNVIKFIEVYETKNQKICLVMDFADRGDLSEIIQKYQGAPIPEPYILAWFVQVVMALNHVHSHRVIHRDVKTSNIFITSSGVIRLGDFGISRILEGTTEFARSLVGTPYYLSPEIIAELPYGFKSDVWSLGVVLYELMTGRHPFRGNSLQQLAVEILQADFEAPPTSYSERLRGLLKRLLAKKADDRPSIQEILRIPFLLPYIAAACQFSGLDFLNECGYNEDEHGEAKALLEKEQQKLQQQAQQQQAAASASAVRTSAPATGAAQPQVARAPSASGSSPKKEGSRLELSANDEEGYGASVSAPPLTGPPRQKVATMKAHILGKYCDERQLRDLLAHPQGSEGQKSIAKTVCGGDSERAGKLLKCLKVLQFLIYVAEQEAKE